MQSVTTGSSSSTAARCAHCDPIVCFVLVFLMLALNACTSDTRCVRSLLFQQFVLSGVLIFIEPGSLTQVFAGSIFSLSYCVVVARQMPYRDPQTNITKLLAEAVLAFVFVCTLSLRNDLAREYLGIEDYTSLMILAVVLGNLIPAIINIWMAFQRYFESLSLLQDSLVSGGGAAEEKNKKLSRWQKTKQKMAKLYSFGVQLSSAFEDLDDMVSSGYDDLEEDDEDEEVDGPAGGSEKTEEVKVGSGDGGEATHARRQADDKWLRKQNLYVRDPITRIIVQKPWKELRQRDRHILEDFGYEEETWDQELPAMRPTEESAVANQPWSYFEEHEELDENATKKTLTEKVTHHKHEVQAEEDRPYAHIEEREQVQKLGFDNADRWRYFMVEKAYSEVVAQRKEMMDYLMVRMSKAVLEDMWKENKSRTWLNRVKLTRDQYFGALTKAWKACERSAIQHTLEHYVSWLHTLTTAMQRLLFSCLPRCPCPSAQLIR
jgi:hypothetical protein